GPLPGTLRSHETLTEPENDPADRRKSGRTDLRPASQIESPGAREETTGGEMIVRRQRADDYEAIRHIYAAAFSRPENPESVPLEVGVFEALWEAGDAIPELSFTARKAVGAVGHVTASRATVATASVVAVGPIGVLPEYQGLGTGSALMDALLSAAD